MKWVKEQIEIKKKKEEAHNTFKPNMKASISSRGLSSARGDKSRNYTNSDVQEKPKGYDKMVNRMKKVQDEKAKLELREYKNSIGERYDKEKLAKVKPPSFLN